jgi:hypothetical protein
MWRHTLCRQTYGRKGLCKDVWFYEYGKCVENGIQLASNDDVTVWSYGGWSIDIVSCHMKFFSLLLNKYALWNEFISYRGYVCWLHCESRNKKYTKLCFSASRLGLTFTYLPLFIWLARFHCACVVKDIFDVYQGCPNGGMRPTSIFVWPENVCFFPSPSKYMLKFSSSLKIANRILIKKRYEKYLVNILSNFFYLFPVMLSK